MKVPIALTALLLAAATPAAAQRKPTKPEKRHMVAALRTECAGCEVRKLRVSTVDPRFAWVFAVDEGFSGVLLHRRTRHGKRFTVRATQGGGVNDCGDWHAPSRVTRDLHLVGLRADGSTGPC